MRQRVALARTLGTAAPVLLMDEPFGALDAMTRDLLHDEFESIWATRGLTVIFVTHNVREAVRLGDRVVLLSSRPRTGRPGVAGRRTTTAPHRGPGRVRPVGTSSPHFGRRWPAMAVDTTTGTSTGTSTGTARPGHRVHAQLRGLDSLDAADGAPRGRRLWDAAWPNRCRRDRPARLAGRGLEWLEAELPAARPGSGVGRLGRRGTTPGSGPPLASR